MEEELKAAGHHPADTNGDGKVSSEEEKMYLEFKRKELDDQDAMRDAQRKMTWFALGGLLLYPFAVASGDIYGPLNESPVPKGAIPWDGCDERDCVGIATGSSCVGPDDWNVCGTSP